MIGKNTVLALMTCAGLLGGQSVLAEDKSSSSSTYGPSVKPIFDQLLRFNVPKGFDTVLEETEGGRYTRKLVPHDEDDFNWTQMIQIRANKGAADIPGASLSQFNNLFVTEISHSCHSPFSEKSIGDFVIGKYPAHAHLASCGSFYHAGFSSSRNELVITLQGDHDMYAIIWTERDIPSAAPLTLDESYWSSRIDAISPFKLCKIVSGETAPYPSCGARY